MSRLDTVGLTPAQLRDLADELIYRWPSAILVKNPVGNLNVRLRHDDYWFDVAWVDLRTGEIELF